MRGGLSACAGCSGGGGNLCCSSSLCSGSSSLGAGGPSWDSSARRQDKQPIRRTADSPQHSARREWERERQLMRAAQVRDWHIPPLITAEKQGTEITLSEIQLSTERTIFDRVASERRTLAAARRATEVSAQQPAAAMALDATPETDESDVSSTPRRQQPAALQVGGAPSPESSAAAGQRSNSSAGERTIGLGLPADAMQLLRRLSGLGEMLGQSPLAQVRASVCGGGGQGGWTRRAGNQRDKAG